MKTGSKVVAIALLFVGLVLVNYLASSIPARIDATGESIYSLSPGTRAMLSKIEEPITLDFYFSKDASGLPIFYKNYAVRVQEMLRQYVRESRGKLILNVIHPRPDTPEEENALAAGLSPQISQQGGDQFFFGLVVTQADQQKNLPAFVPQRESFLEYDLSKLIYGVQQFEKPKLGLLTSLPLRGASAQEMRMAMMMRQAPQPGQYVITEWEQSFNIVTIESTATALPEDLDALAVIHPQTLTPKLQFAIDQFLLSGKPVFLAVDPSSQHFKRQGSQPAMFGGPQPNISSDLAPLLTAYGISYDSARIVGDLKHGTDLRDPQTRQVSRYPTWLSLRKDLFNAQEQPTSSLNSVLMVEAGAIAPAPESTLTFTPLIETSDQSGMIDAFMTQFASGEELARQLTPSGKKTVAALVTGKFKTAFPDGAPKDPPSASSSSDDANKGESKGDADANVAATTEVASLKESATTSTLFIIADTDWLFDEFSFERYSVFGQVALHPINDNLALGANALEFIGGSQDLISIRGKGTSLRPFTVVRDMEVEAQKKYQAKLTELEARLQDVQTRLTELQGKKTEGNRLVATPEIAQAIEDFRKQQAQLSAERRAIRRALREDIDALENRLLVLNLLAAPLLLGVFGFWFHRVRRR